MPRPTTKQDLVQAANAEFDRMTRLIGSIAEEDRNKIFTFEIGAGRKEAHWKRDKNIRDVLVHLFEWHQLLLNWADANMRGAPAAFIPEPYSWKTYGDMNVMFWEKHRSTPYGEAMEMLSDSHKKVVGLIESLTDGELFTASYFKWTGSTTLGSYCASATSSHYAWAIKKINAHIKSLKSK
jgi:hypothetical protein